MSQQQRGKDGVTVETALARRSRHAREMIKGACVSVISVDAERTFCRNPRLSDWCTADVTCT
jgi:hypothetical protein